MYLKECEWRCNNSDPLIQFSPLIQWVKQEIGWLSRTAPTKNKIVLSACCQKATICIATRCSFLTASFSFETSRSELLRSTLDSDICVGLYLFPYFENVLIVPFIWPLSHIVVSALPCKPAHSSSCSLFHPPSGDPDRNTLSVCHHEPGRPHLALGCSASSPEPWVASMAWLRAVFHAVAESPPPPDPIG